MKKMSKKNNFSLQKYKREKCKNMALSNGWSKNKYVTKSKKKWFKGAEANFPDSI